MPTNLRDQHCSRRDYQRAEEIRATAQQTREPLLDVRGLTVEYRGSDERTCVAVADASFQMTAVEIVGIFGQLGSGKTSLGLALLNLLPSTAGRKADALHCHNRDLLKLDESEKRRIRGKEISIMCQEPALALSPVMRVGDQIADVARAHKDTSRRERRETVGAEMTLSFLGLGATEPVASWGNLLAELQQYRVLTSYWWMTAPVFALVLISSSYFLIANSLQRQVQSVAV